MGIRISVSDDELVNRVFGAGENRRINFFSAVNMLVAGENGRDVVVV